MSIADKLQSIETHIGEAYTEISRLGVDLTNVDKNIDNIADKLQDVYADLPKVIGEGSSLSLSPTRKGGLTIIPKGACEQDSYSGKNLFDISKVQARDDIVTLVTNGFTLTKTSNGRFAYYTVFDKVLPAGTYKFVGNETRNDIAGTVGFQYRKENDSTTYSKILGRTLTNTEFTFDSDVSTQGFQFFFTDGSTTGASTTLTDLMLVKSTETDLSYEPYVGGIPSPNPDYPQDIRVVTGDNELLVQNKNLLVQDINSYTYLANSESNHKKIGIVYLEAGTTYNISYTIENATTTNIRNTPELDYDNNHKYYYYPGTNVQLTAGRKTWTFTPTLTGNYTFIYWVATPSNDLTVSDFLISTSSNIDYIAHAEQTYTLHLGTEYLAGIGDYIDELVGKTDDWKIRRYIGKVVLNGSETWNYASNNKNFYINGTNYLPSNQGGKCYTTHFIGNAIDPNYNQDLHSFIGNTSFITIKYFLYTNVNDFKNWLTTHNVTAYYILLEPVEEIITDTTLITDLNNMYQAMGYDGTTNISISSDTSNAQMIASVSALKGE